MRVRGANRGCDKGSDSPHRPKKSSLGELFSKLIDNSSVQEHDQKGCEVYTEESKKVRSEDNPASKTHSRKPSHESFSVRKKSTATESGSKSPTPCGLENLGNTCYLNAILQCLRSTKPVRDFCENYDSGRSKISKNSTDLVDVFIHLIIKMNSVTNGSVSSNTLQKFKSTFASRVPTYKGNLQQDALEFFTYIMDGLHEGIKERSQTPNASEPSSPPNGPASTMPPIQRDPRPKRRRGGLKINEISGHLTGGDRGASRCELSEFSSLKRFSRKLSEVLHPNRMEIVHDVSQPAVSSADATACENSFLKDTFVGHLQTRLRCLQCNNVSTRDELFWNLALCVPEVSANIKDSKEISQNRSSSTASSTSGASPATADSCVTLEDCLNAFTKSETLDDADKPMCSECKTKCKAELQVKISKLPQILVLQFQRFESSCCKTKKRNLIKFGFEQDMAPYYVDGLAEEKTADHEVKASTLPKCTSSPIIRHQSSDSSDGRRTASEAMLNIIEPPVSTRYRLYAVVYHQGGTDRGHYTARCRLPSNPSAPEQESWYFFDDENVSKVPADQGVIHHTAYILFYERIDGKENCEGPIDVSTHICDAQTVKEEATSPMEKTPVKFTTSIGDD
ncbi:hypothetical protein Aperf_G00000106745 [Anoplocephala perfoliata]